MELNQNPLRETVPVNKLDDYLFKIEKKQKPKDEPKNTSGIEKVVAFTYDGLGKEKQIDVDKADAYAKIEMVGGKPRFYLKIAKFGRKAGQLPDPNGFEFVKGETGIKIGGINVYDWIAVKKEAFDSYMKFLKTGERKWLAESRNLVRV